MYLHRALAGFISGVLFTIAFLGCFNAPTTPAPDDLDVSHETVTMDIRPTMSPDLADFDLPDVSKRYIVTFKSAVDDTGKRAKIASAGGLEKRLFRIIPAAAVELPSAAAADALRRDPDVLRVEPDGIALASGFNSDPPWWVANPPYLNFPLAPLQTIPWGLRRIRAPRAWEMTMGAGVSVAVLDTGGFPSGHVDFPLNYGGCVNFVETVDTTDPATCLDGHSHSTHVTGTIAARDNAYGVVGIAPDAEIWNVKVLSDGGVGMWSWIIAGLEWAAENGIDVVNMSLGGFDNSQALHDACDAAADAGVILVAAAGNSGSFFGIPLTNITYPGQYESVIAVAAMAEDGTRGSFSSTGDEMDFAAPGVDVLSTVPDGWAGDWDGTSMATPHVVATVALMLSENPTLSGDCVYEILRLTASSPSGAYDEWNPEMGYGVVHAAAAVLAASANSTLATDVCPPTY